MRICLVYDHLFPQTIGGTERWMRDLALRLAERGHEVTYLTMRHWPGDAAPALPGVRLVGLVDPSRVYNEDRRTLGPPLRFGAAVGWHVARHGGEYDVVHTAAFPFFPLLAARALRSRGYEIVVDWHEVWTRPYWRMYAGAVVGTIGWTLQRACIRVPHRAFCVSRMHARRLVDDGYRGEPIVLPGMYAGPIAAAPADAVDQSLVVYAGRHVKEKRIEALVRGFAYARRRHPDLRLELYGDGPLRPQIEALVAHLGLGDRVRVLGRRPEDEVAEAFARAACVATASEREGYGLVVVEAAARGTPSVVVAGPENAATELVRDGVNGAIAPDASAEAIGAALLKVVEARLSLRGTTAEWFAANASSLTIDRSLEVVLQAYGETPEHAAAQAVRSS